MQVAHEVAYAAYDVRWLTGLTAAEKTVCVGDGWQRQTVKIPSLLGYFVDQFAVTV